MRVIDAIRKRRTVRLFREDVRIPREILLELVDAARLAPSALNKQPFEYIIVDEPEIKEKLFQYLKFGSYVFPERHPKPGFRPSAYIVVIRIKERSVEPWWMMDVGFAVENIFLAALEKGLGAVFDVVFTGSLAEILSVPENAEIVGVVALGVPAEEPVLEESSEKYKYYIDGKGVLHVPKRPLSDIVHLGIFGRRLSGSTS